MHPKIASVQTPEPKETSAYRLPREEWTAGEEFWNEEERCMTTLKTAARETNPSLAWFPVLV